MRSQQTVDLSPEFSRRFLGNESAQFQGDDAIHWLLYEQAWTDVHSVATRAANAAKALASELSRHPKDPRTQETVCDMLSLLFTNGKDPGSVVPSAAAKTVGPELASHLVRVARWHVGDARVCAAAAGALSKLAAAGDVQVVAEDAVAAGAVEVLIEALWKHGEAPSTQAMAAEALGAVLEQQPAQGATAAKLDLAGLLVAAVHKYSVDPSVQGSAGRALQALLKAHEPSAARAAEAGAGAAFVEGLRRNPDSVATQVGASKALESVVRFCSPEVVAAVADAGATGLLLGAVTRNPGNEELHGSACSALAWLVERQPACAAKAAAENAAELCAGALYRFPSSRVVQESACHVLAGLLYTCPVRCAADEEPPVDEVSRAVIASAEAAGGGPEDIAKAVADTAVALSIGHFRDDEPPMPDDISKTLAIEISRENLTPPQAGKLVASAIEEVNGSVRRGAYLVATIVTETTIRDAGKTPVEALAAAYKAARVAGGDDRDGAQVVGFVASRLPGMDGKTLQDVGQLAAEAMRKAGRSDEDAAMGAGAAVAETCALRGAAGPRIRAGDTQRELFYRYVGREVAAAAAPRGLSTKKTSQIAATALKEARCNDEAVSRAAALAAARVAMAQSGDITPSAVMKAAIMGAKASSVAPSEWPRAVGYVASTLPQMRLASVEEIAQLTRESMKAAREKDTEVVIAAWAASEAASEEWRQPWPRLTGLLVDALRRHAGDPGIQARVSIALARFLDHRPAVGADAARFGALALLTEEAPRQLALANEGAYAGVLSAVAQLFLNHHPSALEASAGQLPAPCELLLAALQRPPAQLDAEARRYIAAALAYVCSEKIRLQVHNPGVVIVAVDELRKLLEGYPAFAVEGAARAFVADALIEGMHRHTSDANLQVAVISALRILITEAVASVAVAVEAGAIKALFSALDAHPADASVQASACGAFGQLLETTASMALELPAGALHTLLSALRNHIECEDVQVQASYALASLLERYPEEAGPACDASVMSCLEASFERHPRSGRLRTAATPVMMRLTIISQVGGK